MRAVAPASSSMSSGSSRYPRARPLARYRPVAPLDNAPRLSLSLQYLELALRLVFLDLERAGEEGDRLLDVLVPIVPRMRAGILLVFVGNAEVVEVRVQLAVPLDEEILDPAVYSDRRQRRQPWLLHQSEDIVGPVDRICPHYQPKLLIEVILAAHGEVAEGQRAGMAHGRAEELGELDCQLQRPIAAHGKAADHASLALWDGGKGVVDKADQVFDDRCLVGLF